MNSLANSTATRRRVIGGRPGTPSRPGAARPVLGARDSGTRGSGTLLSIALIACGASTALALTASSAAALSRQNLLHAADASALAAADSRNGFSDGDPCETAALVAAAFGARVSACQPCADAMCVEVSGAFLGIAFTARARASGAVA